MADVNNVSLELAKRLSDRVNEEWKNGIFLDKVTPVTASLLKYWFAEDYREPNTLNFHDGQRQAIMNIIYLHEVVRPKTVLEFYEKIAPDLTDILPIETLAKQKYQLRKYAVKMATGTGKTWVMHALLLWQLLNARHEEEKSGLFTQNFLIVAPGLIVYERLKDAFCGRIGADGSTRDVTTNDFYQCQGVFLPYQYREEVFSFIQNNVVTKEEGIGRKTTGGGLIAITNWHLFENQIEEEEADDDNLPPNKVIEQLLPIRPGKAAGNDLSMLDRRYLRGTELEYLASLDSLMVINDEAHHIHEIQVNGEIEEVEWQKGLNQISNGVGDNFMQVDFSATPYENVGHGENIMKRYFPHIVTDFDLPTAMRMGIVKTLLLDRRQELTDLEDLDYKAVRDERNKVIGLSDGQRLMLRAGLTKLSKLENEFVSHNKSKNPKMMVVCEDTDVSPFVADFLVEEGLSDEDVITIDSNKQGEVKENEWKEIKARLFGIDKLASPKVIVSVLMLREGFDVNNICVIVPLRSSQSPILLEQIIGRGLRLMWREPEYIDTKNEDRKRVLVFHRAPDTYIDMLSVIEHPAFIHFYEELMNEGLAGIDAGDIGTGAGGSVGDIINVGLKENYEEYDFEWPVILREAEDELTDSQLDINDMKPFTMYELEKLRKFLANDGEKFISTEVTSKTVFGQYKVTADLFTANSYNMYLQKILRIITHRFDSTRRAGKGLPPMQINTAQMIGCLDIYIRTKLFNAPFNPFNGNDWKILLAKEGVVTQHIVQQLSSAIVKMQNRVTTSEAEVHHIPFSSVPMIRMRETYSLNVSKAIYPKLGYPSNSGNFERDFIAFLDSDATVEKFLENQ